MDQSSKNIDRKSGKVTKNFGDYGFITADDLPRQDLYFKTAWFQGNSPLLEGEIVTFQLKTFDSKLQAHNIKRLNEIPGEPRNCDPTNKRLTDWAYLGYLPETLSVLKRLALDERWEFKNNSQNPEQPFPILYSYLFHTFGRLALEKKIMINEENSIAAFNTGLVDQRYEAIYALFTPNDDPRTPWKLANFCTSGEGKEGQSLVRYFNPLPPPAHYFDEPIDLLYDVRHGKPELSWQHIIIENVDRFPSQFLEDYCPPNFVLIDTSGMSDEDKDDYFQKLGEAIKANDRTYRAIMNRFKDGLDLSVKRVTWNFKAAIPQYYPRVKKLTLLLPICLVSDEVVDLALAVEKTQSGNYLGHTILLLDWAYKNARLICRPDSDWLTPERIEEGMEEQM